MLQIPLGYRRQYTKRETRINIHTLSRSTQFSQSRACVFCNMLTHLKHVQIIKLKTGLTCDISFEPLKN